MQSRILISCRTKTNAVHGNNQQRRSFINFLGRWNQNGSSSSSSSLSSIGLLRTKDHDDDDVSKRICRHIHQRMMKPMIITTTTSQKKFSSFEGSLNLRFMHTSSNPFAPPPPATSSMIKSDFDDDDDDDDNNILSHAHNEFERLLEEEISLEPQPQQQQPQQQTRYSNLPEFESDFFNREEEDQEHDQQQQQEEELKPLDEVSMSSLITEFFDPKSPPPRSDLRQFQLHLECESQRETAEIFERITKSARERGDYTSLPLAQRQLIRWYTPIRDAIKAEQDKYISYGRKNRKGMNMYGPFLCSLPPEKLAVIASHQIFTALLQKGGMATVANVSTRIGNAIEAEVLVERIIKQKAQKQREAKALLRTEKDDDDDGRDLDIASQSSSSATTTPTLIDKIDYDEASDDDDEEESSDLSLETDDDDDLLLPLDNDNHDHDTNSLSYGASHLARLVQELNRYNPKRAQTLRISLINRCGKKLLHGTEKWSASDKIQLGVALVSLFIDEANVELEQETRPAFRYEKRWLAKDRSVGYVALDEGIFNMIAKDTSECLRGITARPQPMVVPPRIWTTHKDGGYAALHTEFMRTHGCQIQQQVLRHADLSMVFDGLNALGRVPWRINRGILDAAHQCWNEGVVLGDIPSRKDFDLPVPPTKPDWSQNDDKDSEEYKESMEQLRAFNQAQSRYRRVRQKNMDLRSLRCSVLLKLNQAEKFKLFDNIYFPYNIDFRGRAYPVPPHLSNIGSDLCRGMLMFSKSKPLGPRGLFWLKVHLANLAGADKMSFSERANFTEENMDNVRAAAKDPFGPNRWWMTLDDPFQGLATCREIIAAMDSGNPETYECALPVHMDGSCNGLQHYAALGRDQGGGKAVNLCPTDEPQDVYIGVMHEVERQVAEDAAVELDFDTSDPEKFTKSQTKEWKKRKAAQLVNGHIDRGVVKRTVMTSVYGVTYIGARKQIEEKIEEKLEEAGFDVDAMQSEINEACGYLATVTMKAMGKLFTGARQTMTWLSTCARLISSQGQPVSWITPIGVPAIQPYRRTKPYTVVTYLQTVVLTDRADDLPVHRQRQSSAFPPNYVHSLDSSHMLLTALEMERRGLSFSAVHDSFWTHACDIDEMNDVLRECFVELYDQPLLEDLKRSWEIQYPNLQFPKLPKVGDLNLNDVKKASYFFQ